MLNHEDIVIVMTVNKFYSISKAAKMMYMEEPSSWQVKYSHVSV